MILGQYFLEAGVPEDKLEECYCWAFGIDYANIPLMNFGDRWRELHGDLFMVEDGDLIAEVFLKIGKAFLKRP